MPWQVAGLRERRYRVETADQVSVWVADEIELMSQGWVPLSSERTSGGWMRVTYGMLPPELGEAEHETKAAVGQGKSRAAALGGVAMLLAMVGLATAFGFLPYF